MMAAVISAPFKEMRMLVIWSPTSNGASQNPVCAVRFHAARQ